MMKDYKEVHRREARDESQEPQEHG
jgi:hypothetical protein